MQFAYFDAVNEREFLSLGPIVAGHDFCPFFMGEKAKFPIFRESLLLCCHRVKAGLVHTIWPRMIESRAPGDTVSPDVGPMA